MEELENSKNPEIHVYVADALMALDDYEGAVEEINEALEKNIVNVNYGKSLKGEEKEAVKKNVLAILKDKYDEKMYIV